MRTHRGALDYPDSVCQHLISERQLGRVAGPFLSVPFADSFVISPLNIVKKRDSSERRVIVDLSWPCGSFVNDGILSDSFLGVPIDLHYHIYRLYRRCDCGHRLAYRVGVFIRLDR